MGEIIIKFVAIHCSLTTLYHRLGRRLSTTCASFLAAAFHGYPRLAHRFWRRLSTTCASFLAAAFHGMCIVFGSGFPRLFTTCAPFFCVFRGQYGSIAGCGPCGRPLTIVNCIYALFIFGRPLTLPSRTLQLSVTRNILAVRYKSIYPCLSTSAGWGLSPSSKGNRDFQPRRL